MTLSAKKEVLKIIKDLPEKVNYDDIMHEIYVRKKIAEGIEAADNGKLIYHQEIKKHFLKGLHKRPSNFTS